MACVPQKTLRSLKRSCPAVEVKCVTVIVQVYTWRWEEQSGKCELKLLLFKL